MTFSSAIVVLLGAGLITPLHSQVDPKPKLTIPPGKEIPVHAAVCPKDDPRIKCVDLCALAERLDAKDQPIRLDGLKKNFLLANHDEIRLRYDKKDQIVWTCQNQSFEIVTIERVWNHDCPKDPSVPDSPPPLPFPFAPPKNYFGVVQKPGSLLYSGPPVKAAIGQRFKYTFMVGVKKYDPHVIVTGGSERLKPCPHPAPNPTPAKSGVKSKQ